LRCLRTNIELQEEELEAFYMDLGGSTEKNTLSSRSSSVDFNAKIGPRRTAEKLHIGTHGMEWNDPGNETPRPPSTGTTSLPLRVNGKIPLSTTPMKNTTGSSNIFTIVLGKQKFTSSQETTLFEDSRADTPAWNRASHRQLSTNVRTCEAM
ncbi:hypothetical protein V3C99_004369, partial [Haemonchus contortus]